MKKEKPVDYAILQQAEKELAQQLLGVGEYIAVEVDGMVQYGVIEKLIVGFRLLDRKDAGTNHRSALVSKVRAASAEEIMATRLSKP